MNGGKKKIHPLKGSLYPETLKIGKNLKRKRRKQNSLTYKHLTKYKQKLHTEWLQILSQS